MALEYSAPPDIELPVHKRPLREMVFLAEQAKEGNLRILPSSSWGFHYAASPEERAEKLQAFQSGEITSDDIVNAFTPEALLYDTDDIERFGLDHVSSRIRDLSAYIANFDVHQFITMLDQLKGRDIDEEGVGNIFRQLNRARTQKKMLDAYGRTGRRQIEESLRSEANQAKGALSTGDRLAKIFNTLKHGWISESLDLVSATDHDAMIANLSGQEREVVKKLKDAYGEYIESGDERSYQKLIESIKEELPKIEKVEPPDGSSEAMENLDKELEPFEEKVGDIGTPEDPAIPPEDQDEYHTPEPAEGGKESEKKSQPFFEISPPLGGYYASGRKSFFDIASKTWSKKKSLSPHASSVVPGLRYRISGTTGAGLKSIPMPVRFTIDSATVEHEGSVPKFHRDQNGCSYIETSGTCKFSVEFGQEIVPNESGPVPEDTQQLSSSDLQGETENVIANLRGQALQKAERLRQFLLARHFYPGGGDAHKAQALQHKLRSESSGDNYIQNLEASEYLECYSANTLFIAMCRKAGVPARLVVGHKVEGASDGKSAIDKSTGHAWTEIWDGKTWRRIDATPSPKPEDKKEGQDKGEQDEDKKKESAPEADDGGVENKSQSSPNSDNSSEQPGNTESAPEKMEVSDEESQEASQQLENAQQEVSAASEQKQSMSEQISEVESFQELADLEEQAKESDMFDDWKEDLQEKIEAKAEEMKKELRDDLDQMTDDGFIDEDRREEMEKELQEKGLQELDQLKEMLEHESRLFDEYDEIREEVEPLVEEWYEYFAERLPKEDEISSDEDAFTRQGVFARKAIRRPSNLIFGTVKNPRLFSSSSKPRFLASIVVDVSGSMGGGNKLRSARKLAVFYSELFSKISREFGYIRFSLSSFSDTVQEIKRFDQDYDSPSRYGFDDGKEQTVKVRLMDSLTTKGGTNMLVAVRKTAADLNEEAAEYPDYASAMYFVGDGGDTCGNGRAISEFLESSESEGGFGDHMYSAVLLGDESQRQELASIFGDDHTSVAPDFGELIEASMEKFEDDIENYLQNKK